MKIKDIISEAFTKSPSRYSSGPQSVTRSIAGGLPSLHPTGGYKSGPPSFIVKSMKQKRNREEKFNALPTAKEKFDFLYNIKTAKAEGNSVINISIRFPDANGTPGRWPLQIRKYDPASGNIELFDNRNKIEYSSNTKDFMYVKRERGPSSTLFNYIFVAKPKTASTSAVPAYQRGEF
jgi:hypothetical protein